MRPRHASCTWKSPGSPREQTTMAQ
jgi:hypothetical protein